MLMADSAFPDLLGHFLRRSGPFRGKGRLALFWIGRRNAGDKRIRVLPGGGEILCDLSIPYEAMVWLEHEEEEELGTLARLLKPGQVFVDCGANIGIWSLVAASTVGEKGRVYAFEPNPATCEKLANNVSRGGWKNIRVVPAAVGGRDGEAHFRCEAAHNVSRTVERPGEATIPVPMMTLDSVLGRERISGCKIDVEGNELDVLRGAERLIGDMRPWFCVEFNTLLTRTRTLGEWNVHRYLRERGYAAHRFPDALNAARRTALPDTWQTTGYCNLYYTTV